MGNIKEVRQDQIPLKCEICEKQFKKSNSLKTHFNITHNLEEEHEWKKHHKCASCKISFPKARSTTS